MSDQSDNRTYGAAPPDGTSTPWASTPTPPPVPPTPNGKRNGGIVAGIMLIAIGGIFLAGQVVPGLAWWTLWPLIIVLAGVIQMFTPGHRGEWGVDRVMDGLGTVILGLVLLGCTLGVISWGVWWTFITLWPILLIALGLNILGRGLQMTWLRTLSPIVIWLALAYAVSLSLTGMSGLQPMPSIVRPVTAGQPFAISEPVNGATSATLDFKGGAGDIRFRGGSDLINATGVSPYGTPTSNVSRTGSSAAVDFTLGSDNHTVFIPGVSAARADIALSETTVWDTTFETGATSMNIDLSTVPVQTVTLKTGASSVALKLGQVPSTSSTTDVSIKAGVSSIEVLVPKGAAVQVATHNGLSATNVDSSLAGMGSGLWQTPGYSSASKVINVSIESGVSSVSVKTY